MPKRPAEDLHYTPADVENVQALTTAGVIAALHSIAVFLKLELHRIIPMAHNVLAVKPELSTAIEKGLVRDITMTLYKDLLAADGEEYKPTQRYERLGERLVGIFTVIMSHVGTLRVDLLKERGLSQDKLDLILSENPELSYRETIAFFRLHILAFQRITEKTEDEVKGIVRRILISKVLSLLVIMGVEYAPELEEQLSLTMKEDLTNDKKTMKIINDELKALAADREGRIARIVRVVVATRAISRDKGSGEGSDESLGGVEGIGPKEVGLREVSGEEVIEQQEKVVRLLKLQTILLDPRSSAQLINDLCGDLI